MTEGQSRRRWAVFISLAALVLIADQISKGWIDATFPLASPHTPGAGPQPTPVIGDFVRIAKTYNTGGIFGLFGASAPILAVASTFVIIFIAVYHWREAHKQHWAFTVALGLLLGGAIGNLIDRIRFGHVIDFVDTGIGSVRWYTFNVADSAISVSLLLLIVIALLGERLTPRQQRVPATS